MKTDFEILLTLLMLIKVVTTLRLTPSNTVAQVQHSVLLEDIKVAYQLAHYKVAEYNEVDNTLGKKFFYLFYVLTMIPIRHKHAGKKKGVYEVIDAPDDYWLLASQILHAGFNKNGGLELFQEKRKLCHMALEIVMATGASPAIVPKKSLYVMEKLLERVFEYGVDQNFHEQPELSQLDEYRYDALSSIYRLVDLTKQMGAMSKEGKKRGVVSTDHIAWVKSSPKLDTVSAMGHANDVQLAHFLLETKLHEPFAKSHMKNGQKKT